MIRLRDRMTTASRAKYLLWRLASRCSLLPEVTNITVLLKSGPVLVLRNNVDDLAVAHEIFITDVYHWPGPSDGRSETGWIVDLGGNVGYATVDFALRYPEAMILTVEPLPEHVGLIARHVSLNQLQQRVQLISGAAHTSDGKINIVSDGIRSHLSKNLDGTIVVDRLDIYKCLAGLGKILLLKMDIEGGEFDILGDPRLRTLPIERAIVEWHHGYGYATPTEAARACVDLLERAGLRVVRQIAAPPYGVVYAERALQESAA